MTFEKAKQEFKIRYYLWTISEWEKEINESFPNLCHFKSGRCWEIFQFMQQLDKSERLILGRGLLKESDAAKMLGENLSPEEESLVWRCNNFFRIREQYYILKQNEKQIGDFRALFQMCFPDAIKILGDVYLGDEKMPWSRLETIFQSIPPRREEQLAARKLSGEKIKFVSKPKLRKALVSKFIDAFGSQCVDMKISKEWDPQFHIKCCGWIINTQLALSGRQGGAFWYRHIIESENRVPHPRFPELGTVPIVILSTGAAWLESRWENVMDEDVEVVSNTIVKIAGFFFEAAPRLLKGLEFEKMVSE